MNRLFTRTFFSEKYQLEITYEYEMDTDTGEMFVHQITDVAIPSVDAFEDAAESDLSDHDRDIWSEYLQGCRDAHYDI